MIFETAEYQLIRFYYGAQKANRSQVPLINHIDEGLQILIEINANLTTQRAYCLHPIFQADNDLAVNYTRNFSALNTKAIIFTMEYRNIANQYLSKRKIAHIEDIHLSPLKEVNQMLIADKVQNRKDFDLYHKDTHPRSEALSLYFDNWLKRLGVSEKEYLRLIGLL